MTKWHSSRAPDPGWAWQTAQAFAQAWASVVLADSNEKSAHSAAERIKAQEYAALPIHCNVAEDVQVDVMVREILAKFGRVDAATTTLAGKLCSPMARVGRPEEIANAVLWLCGDASSDVTGQT